MKIPIEAFLIVAAIAVLFLYLYLSESKRNRETFDTIRLQRNRINELETQVLDVKEITASRDEWRKNAEGLEQKRIESEEALAQTRKDLEEALKTAEVKGIMNDYLLWQISNAIYDIRSFKGKSKDLTRAIARLEVTRENNITEDEVKAAKEEYEKRVAEFDEIVTAQTKRNYFDSNSFADIKVPYSIISPQQCKGCILMRKGATGDYCARKTDRCEAKR